MNPPLILVITPTFNNGAKIAATVASVLSQRKGLFEFVVIDGGSTEVIGRLGKYKKGTLRRGMEIVARIYQDDIERSLCCRQDIGTVGYPMRNVSPIDWASTAH